MFLNSENLPMYSNLFFFLHFLYIEFQISITITKFAQIKGIRRFRNIIVWWFLKKLTNEEHDRKNDDKNPDIELISRNNQRINYELD